MYRARRHGRTKREGDIEDRRQRGPHPLVHPHHHARRRHLCAIQVTHILAISVGTGVTRARTRGEQGWRACLVMIRVTKYIVPFIFIPLLHAPISVRRAVCVDEVARVFDVNWVWVYKWTDDVRCHGVDNVDGR
ncbi:hypothetical protein BJ138DRAFT_1106259 [Hygrophoropsis aurantiaca]|uniref:Uncharacterized protein n=1 Tax=Hygrophoropsis aurantiaca TaxID=72124 RepID=A0ACB7ZVX9_9AGAM|nr:hypothetical protein BJ138DRAFT_1106259 [Hygrophoropsis aurantiaca]